MKVSCSIVKINNGKLPKVGEINEMQLSDFYYMFPDLNTDQVRIHFIRNEIYVALVFSERQILIIDYFSDDKIKVTYKDSDLKTTLHMRTYIRHKYQVDFNQDYQPTIMTNYSNLKHDCIWLMRLLNELDVS